MLDFTPIYIQALELVGAASALIGVFGAVAVLVAVTHEGRMILGAIYGRAREKAQFERDYKKARKWASQQRRARLVQNYRSSRRR